MVIDMGTGDGRAVLALAAAEPTSLVIGIDAHAAAMAESSRRAARSAARGGRANAMFVAAAAEAPPTELAGVADLITVTLPWASLLDGVLGRDHAVACGLAGLVVPGGTIEAIVSSAARDRGDRPLAADDASGIAAAWAPLAFGLETFRPLAREELAGIASTWARRLRLGSGAEGDRVSWRLTLRSSRGRRRVAGPASIGS